MLTATATSTATPTATATNTPAPTETATQAPTSTDTQTPSAIPSPKPTKTPEPTATVPPVHGMTPFRCGVPNVFLGGFDVDPGENYELDYILPDAVGILLGFDGHRGYDWLVPPSTEAFPVFYEEGTVADVRLVPNKDYYWVEIAYKHHPATQIADLVDVRVTEGDKVKRTTALGLARQVNTHPELDPVYQKYGVDGMIHVSFREKPGGGDKVRIPGVYGSPFNLPCE